MILPIMHHAANTVSLGLVWTGTQGIILLLKQQNILSFFGLLYVPYCEFVFYCHGSHHNLLKEISALTSGALMLIFKRISLLKRLDMDISS